ncbi:DUF4168 domain-containing protein [Roseicitreum antarcticum]|uniref:DUF4168 domain-containing protein n=1 Tax=Roseicitreum antarcticum TaxID=564137 RepID=A0A1H2XDM2_9RHOB|nr:DUF4168 domain-containing protein [Roseicitreum antarcticum]SDW90554.1 protein of unknown function [Roseicitreum antarcticum]
MLISKRLQAMSVAILFGVTAPLALPVTAQETVTASDSVSDTQLDAFMQALNAVNEVETTYVERVEAETDAEARDALIAEANEAMVGAVEETDGITVDDYVAIMRLAQTDEALNARIVARLDG